MKIDGCAAAGVSLLLLVVVFTILGSWKFWCAIIVLAVLAGACGLGCRVNECSEEVNDADNSDSRESTDAAGREEAIVVEAQELDRGV